MEHEGQCFVCKLLIDNAIGLLCKEVLNKLRLRIIMLGVEQNYWIINAQIPIGLINKFQDLFKDA